jgi:hypothetical protein
MFLGLLIWELFAFEPEISFESTLTQDRLYNRVMTSFAPPKGIGVSPLLVSRGQNLQGWEIQVLG